MTIGFCPECGAELGEYDIRVRKIRDSSTSNDHSYVYVCTKCGYIIGFSKGTY